MSEDAHVGSDKYLYGIVLADESPRAATEGVQGAQLYTLGSGRVAAIVSDLVETDILGTPADLRAHIAVLDGIAESQSVLPLAFGTVVPEDADIPGDVLAPREAEYVEALEILSGLGQFTVSIRYDRDTILREIIQENPDAAELREIIAGTNEDETRTERIRLGEIVVKTMESWRQAEAPPILKQLEPLTADMSVRESGQAEDVAEVAVLLRQESVTEFDEVIERLAEANQERMRFRLVGPQAPYDFVPEM